MERIGFGTLGVAALRLAVAAASLPTGAAMAQKNDAFEMEVSVAPEAARRIAGLGEHVGIAVVYFGRPIPGGRVKGDEMEQIALGTEDAALPATGGHVRFAGRTIRRRLIGDILHRQVLINVNVFSSGRPGQTNVIDCGFYEGPLAAVSQTPLRMSCKPL